MNELPNQHTHDFAEILDVSCQPVGDDPCGRASSGYMIIRGDTTEMKIESKLMLMPDGKLEMSKDGAESCYVILDSKDDWDLIEVGMTVKCLDIMRDKNGLHGNYVSGLVLHPVDRAKGSFRRIGFSTMLVDHYHDSKVETITIL